MSFCQRVAALSSVIIFIAIMSAATPAQNAPATQTTANASDPQFNPRMYQDLEWRCIGPFRGGRTVAATGVASKPNFFTSA